jgi:exopolyphosphatase / guanosine-5'-triphosphate,3'-diphosphate pyrophosphatase
MVTGFTSRLSRRRAVDNHTPVAVVDCGTSSVRTTIAELVGDQVRILEELHYPIDLTPAFTSEKLDRQAMETVADACEAVAAAAKNYGVTVLRAVATSALREAANADVLVELVRSRTGVELEIIEAAEEARLYVEALRVICDREKIGLPGVTLMMDVGGGGTSVSLIRDGRLVFSVDEHFGTVRLLGQLGDLADDSDFGITVDRFSLGAAKMMLSRLPERGIDRLVVNGGDVRRLFHLLGGDDHAVAEMSVASVEKWCRKMLPLTQRDRALQCGLDDEIAAGLLLPAACVVRHLCAFTGHDRVLVPQLTLRDGLLADFRTESEADRQINDDTLRAEAMQLVRRFGCDKDYAESTASLAVQIFDQTRDLHGLDDRNRMLLEFAALVHDIGSYLNVRNRHKHAMYLIEAVDIAGMTLGEKQLVAQVARYHRRSPPQPHHVSFQALPRPYRVVVSYLAAILRIAYGLDVERTQRIRKVRCQVDNGKLLLHVDRRQIALERWSIEGKCQMFEEVFGLKVVVVPREEE